MSEITAEQKKQLLKLEGFKEIQKQFAKEQKQAGAGKKRMRGNGFWDSVGSWFKSVGTSINDFLKRTKIISNIAGAVLPLLAPLGTALLTANPIAAAASVGAAKAATEGIKSLGYGSKMRGMGNDPLVINLPNQRMRGINPKSKPRGAGKGFLQDALNIVAPLGGFAIQTGLDLIDKSKKMKGKGYGTSFNTFGENGVPQMVSVPAHSGMMGNIGGIKKGKPAIMKGMGGTEYGVVSSEFGNVKF